MRRMFSKPDRRDRFLVLMGAVFVLLGYAYTIVTVPHGVRTPIDTIIGHVPLWAFGIAWLATGVYSVMAGFTDRHIGGFTVAVAMPFLWGAIYLVSWINGDPGRGWVTTGVFWGLSAAVYSVAGLVDPTPIATPLHHDEDTQ
jgi:hypothetical protein